MSFGCPACGFFGLSEPPLSGGTWSHEICPCCGIHFGYDHSSFGPGAFEKWRLQWVDSGKRWFSQATPPPENWDPVAQLDFVIWWSIVEDLKKYGQDDRAFNEAVEDLVDYPSPDRKKIGPLRRELMGMLFRHGFLVAEHEIKTRVLPELDKFIQRAR